MAVREQQVSGVPGMLSQRLDICRPTLDIPWISKNGRHEMPYENVESPLCPGYMTPGNNCITKSARSLPNNLGSNKARKHLRKTSYALKTEARARVKNYKYKISQVQ